MTSVDRRTALACLLAAGVAFPAALAAEPSLAQTDPVQGGDQADYVTQTLSVGTLAMKTSEIAVEKATDPMVKEFAGLEVAEQKTIAGVLAATEAGKTPPALAPEDQAKVDELNGMEPGPDFDAAYVKGQIEGHNRLLEIQRTLSGETEPTVEAITARLAEQAVTSHLAMLNHIQAALGGAATGSAAPAEGTAAPTQGEAAPAAGTETPSN